MAEIEKVQAGPWTAGPPPTAEIIPWRVRDGIYTAMVIGR